MSILVPKRRTRRDVLKGIFGGSAVSVALPFLDCFLNSNGTALASGAPLPTRFGTWFWGLGHTPGRGVGEALGADYSFGPECQALERHKQYINYFSAFNLPLDGKPSAVHFTGWVGPKTGTVPIGFGKIADPTLDVLVADTVGDGTRFRSIEATSTGNANDSYSYRNSASHNAAEVTPVGLYARIFGPGFVDPNTSNFKPDPLVLARKSVLSAVDEQSKSFIQSLGYSDKERMDEYFTSIRQLENQLALQMEKPPPLDACVRPVPPEDAPIGLEIEDVTNTHEAMSKVLALAVACNQTKIFNLLYSQAASEVRHRGASFTHHILTHEEPPDPVLGYQVESAELNVKAMEALAFFINEFSSIREGDGTLLDNVLIFAQTDTSVAKTHSVNGIPTMLIGRAGHKLKSGYHVSGKGDPITRIGLTAMQVMGVPVQEWGTGSLRTDKVIDEILVNA